MGYCTQNKYYYYYSYSRSHKLACTNSYEPARLHNKRYYYYSYSRSR